jgi:hypothetical protein
MQVAADPVRLIPPGRLGRIANRHKTPPAVRGSGLVIQTVHPVAPQPPLRVRTDRNCVLILLFVGGAHHADNIRPQNALQLAPVPPH